MSIILRKYYSRKAKISIISKKFFRQIKVFHKIGFHFPQVYGTIMYCESHIAVLHITGGNYEVKKFI